jgi:hypothetical protein
MNKWTLFLIVIIAIAGAWVAIEQTTQNSEDSQSISHNNSSQDYPKVNYSEIDVQMKKLWY